MYVMITYDVSDKRTERFRKLLTRYLRHEQNSVFSGDMPESMLLDLQGKLTRIMRPDDRLMQVTAANRHNVGLAILKKDPTTGNLKVNAHNHHKTDAGVL